MYTPNKVNCLSAKVVKDSGQFEALDNIVAGLWNKELLVCGFGNALVLYVWIGLNLMNLFNFSCLPICITNMSQWI